MNIFCCTIKKEAEAAGAAGQAQVKVELRTNQNLCCAADSVTR